MITNALKKTNNFCFPMQKFYLQAKKVLLTNPKYFNYNFDILELMPFDAVLYFHPNISIMSVSSRGSNVTSRANRGHSRQCFVILQEMPWHVTEATQKLLSANNLHLSGEPVGSHFTFMYLPAAV